MPAKQKGELYIGVIIGMAIMMILTQAIVSLIFAAYDFVGFNRARTTARHIAQEQIEVIRNMSYDSIGTQGGVPAGSLPQEETTNRNGQTYTIARSIIYVDDEYDNTAPTDNVPADYKRVRINVSWGGVSPSNVTLVTDISPVGVENVVGGGTLSILVLDAQGVPVSQAQVHVTSSTVSPPVDTTQLTNSNGRMVLTGVPICNGCYRVEVSKTAFSTERTYSVAEVANPVKPDLTILEGQVTDVSFAIDRLAIFRLAIVSDRDNNFVPLANQVIRVQGTKIIGTTELDEPVFKYDEEFTSNGSGEIVIANLEWDVYGVAPSASSGRMISSTNPLLPVSVHPNSDTTLTLGLSTISNYSVMASFLDTSQTQVASAAVTLKKSPDYEESRITGTADDPDFGQVFFSDLEAGTYTIEATASGFQSFTDTILVDENEIPTFTLIQ
jgi:hypothetical protein